jgi:hypothetical protein
MAINMGEWSILVCYLEQKRYLLHKHGERGMKAFDFSVSTSNGLFTVGLGGGSSMDCAQGCGTRPPKRSEKYFTLLKIGGSGRSKFN